MANKFMRMIRELSDEELELWESSMRTDLSAIRTQVKQGGSVRNYANFVNLRRNIARIHTVKNERQNS